MEIFDTHCHLNSRQFDGDRSEVLRRAIDAGVTRILVVGYDLPSSRMAVDLADEVPGIYAAVGVHPHDAKLLNEGVLKELERLTESRKVVAIGETGLDYFRDLSPRTVQRDAFRLQLKLAKAKRLPVVIHDRNAHDEVLSILNEESVREIPVILHCFSGDERILKRCMERGYYVSFSGSITYQNPEKVHTLVQAVDEEKMLVETDAPYLAPEPYRRRRNEPAYVRTVTERLAQLRGTSLKRMAEITSRNALRAFGL